MFQVFQTVAKLSLNFNSKLQLKLGLPLFLLIHYTTNTQQPQHPPGLQVNYNFNFTDITK